MTEFVVYTEIGPKNHSESHNALGIAVWTHYAYMSRLLLPSKGLFQKYSVQSKASVMKVPLVQHVPCLL